VLSHDERHRLERIETWTSVDDPAFAAGLASGRPRHPHEYRRWPATVLLSLGLVLVLAAVALAHWLPGTAAVLSTATGAVVWRRRRLDRPARLRGGPKWYWWR